jgi:hypothetical protein
MEDVELMRRIKKSGDKIWIFSDPVMTSPRRWEKEGVIRCTLRNWALQTLYRLGVSPRTLAAFYRNGGAGEGVKAERTDLPATRSSRLEDFGSSGWVEKK